MCGRYGASTPPSVLAEEFDVDEVVVEDQAPSYNVAPTDPVPAIAVNRAGSRVLGQFSWGLVPSWEPDRKGAARRINARAETVLDKPAFRNAFARRRCLLPADGFYEWERRPDGSKQPWFVHRADGRPMAMAGLWEVWRETDDAPLLRTCTVITTAANDLMQPVHDRMPVILERPSWSGWLDRDSFDADALSGLLIPAGDDVLIRHRVSNQVNSVRNNGPDLVEPVPEPAPPPVPLKLL
jgi:putative SOS response-associated peptidase YedK